MAGRPTFIKAVSAYDEETRNTIFELYVVTFDGEVIEKLPQHPFVGGEPEELNLLGISSGIAFFSYVYMAGLNGKGAILSYDNENGKWEVVVEDIFAYLDGVTGDSGDTNSFKSSSILGFSALTGTPFMYINRNSYSDAKLYRINLDSLVVDSLGSYIWYTSIVNDAWIVAGPFIYMTNDTSQQVVTYAGAHGAVAFSSNNEEALLEMRAQA